MTKKDLADYYKFIGLTAQLVTLLYEDVYPDYKTAFAAARKLVKDQPIIERIIFISVRNVYAVNANLIRNSAK
jgi:hypothetical protein